MTNQEAIETIEANYPPQNYTMLREALDMAISLLKEQEVEYEKGYNDAMLDKQELMYESIDGKWYKKDW